MGIPLHVKLLQSLQQLGIGVETDISKFMQTNFEKPKSSNVEEWSRAARPPIIFLDDLLYRGLISFEDTNDEGIFKPFNANHLEKPQWYDSYKTVVYITSKGLDYLDKYYLQQSYFSLNGASHRNYKIQRIFSFVTITIATLSGLITILTFSSSKDINDKVYSLQLQINILRKELKQSKSLQTPLQTPKKILLDFGRKH